MKWDTDATDVVLEIIEVATSTVELDRLVKEADNEHLPAHVVGQSARILQLVSLPELELWVWPLQDS